jgi:hypothetical protein
VSGDLAYLYRIFLARKEICKLGPYVCGFASFT